jgi:hypothetical protein
MRAHVQLIVSVVVLAAVGLLLVVAFHGTAGAALADPASAIRGSLGTPLEDLSLENSTGALTLILNGGFVLLAGVWALLLTRSPHTRVRGSAPTVLRPTLNRG